MAIKGPTPPTAYVPTAQSFVILPEALAFITNRSNPENVRAAFAMSQRQGGLQGGNFAQAGCVRQQSVSLNASEIVSACIAADSPGFRLLNLINPATGNYYILTLSPGRYERLFYNTNNVRILRNGVTRITDFSIFGLPVRVTYH